MNLITLIKSPNLIAAAIIILLVLATIFLGSILHISWMLRIGIIVFILLIAVIILLYRKMKAVQKAGQIEQSIGAQADAQMKSLSPEKRAEIEQFKKQLEAAIASLKNSKLGKGKLGKSALYALPWYMIIGPSAAGKTTAIQNSGLEFPFGKEGFRGVGGTRNCDWFFSTKGIFLDTAGRYVTQTEDRIEWLAFLETLRKNRKRKPVNGIIVALNIDEIISCEKDQLYEHAKNIRQRIDELIENLGVNFPVYFVFTKCDLIQGFVEYFGDFSEIERSQIWGATLTANQQLDLNPKNVFETEFKKLSDRLFEIRTIRLASPLKREQRRKVFLFPFQFQTLQKKLAYLIGEVFQPNPYQDNPIFRGFYLTSGTQEGVPLDIAIREIAKQFNLPGKASDESEEIVEKKNYFIKDLLNDIVIGDQNYSTGKTTGVIKKRSATRLTVIAAAAVLLIIFSIFTFIGYSGSSSSLENINTASISFTKINWSGDLLKNFKEAENLRLLIEKVENGEANESFISFGLDRSEEAIQPLEDLYLKKTEPFFTQNIYDEIVRNLNNYANGQDYSGEEIYNFLKSYLLLGNERTRLDTSGQKYLASFFAEMLNSRFIISNPLASISDKDSLKYLFRNYTSFFTSKLSDKNVYPVRNDNLLINLVRSRIQYRPNAESIYARLKQNGIAQFPNDLTLELIIGGQYSNLIRTDTKVPYIFTADGWKNYIEGAVIEESLNPGKEDWVLGKPQIKPASDSEMDSDEMRKNLLVLYLNDYQQTWLQFLQNIKYYGFETVPLAANNLKILSDPVSSPLVNVLKVFADQLKIISDIQSPDSTDGSTLKVNFSGAKLPEVKKYRKLVVGAEDGSISAELNAIMVQYAILSSVFESIKGGQDLCKDYAVKVITQRAIEFPASLQAIRGTTSATPALQNLFIEPVILSWQAILSDASQYLNLQWKAKVVDPFNKTLANSFPFKNTSSDAPIQDFKDFFKPQDGILWTFFNEELSEFINKERWKVNQWENQGLSISNNLIAALKKANDISTTLFKSGDLGFSFRLKQQPPDSKPIRGQKPYVEQVYLYLNGDEDSYKMGSPFWKDYSWPGNKGTPGARMNISMRDIGTSDTKAFDGEWALFRLLGEASSSSESSSQYQLNWFFQKDNLYNVTVAYFLNAGSSKNPFSNGFFNSFNLPNKIN